MQRSLPLLFLFSHALLKCGTFAFIRSTIHTRQPSRSLLTPNRHLSDGNEDNFDAEAARRQLEGLVTISAHPFRDEEDFPPSLWHSAISEPLESYYYDNLTHAPPRRVEIELPLTPPLTTCERERRLVEISLLQRLIEGQDSVTDLTHLWCHERGSKAAARLWKTDHMIEQGSWDDAEQELRKLINEYGVYWTEPIHRLATLMIRQNRFVEAERMFMIVLAVKPWHMGALSGIVLTYAGLNDNQHATEWAARRLPGTGGHRRTSWSRAAVHAAQDSLFDAEERLRDMFGARDIHHSILRCRGVFVPADGICFWQ